jgi:hypothetical protein
MEYINTKLVRVRTFALFDERNVETAQQTELGVKEVRRELDAVYQQITDRIDAMLNLHGRDFVPVLLPNTMLMLPSTKTNSHSILDVSMPGKKNNSDNS